MPATARRTNVKSPAANRKLKNHRYPALFMRDFDADRGGWIREELRKLDAVSVGWRRLAARFDHGIQEPPIGAHRT